MQLEPPCCRAAGWGGGLCSPCLCMFLESFLLPGLVLGGPRDAPDQGPERMLIKPFPRVTGKFSIQRPVVMVVVSVSVHIRQTGPSGVRLSVYLLSLSHAGLELRDVLANPSQGSSQPQNLQSGLPWALSSSSLLLSSASVLK